MTLKNPWFLLVILIFVIPFFVKRFRYHIKFPNVKSLSTKGRMKLYSIPTIILIASAVLTIIAVCGPQVGVQKTKTEKLRTSTALTVDLSSSMRSTTRRRALPSKFENVQKAAKKFIDQMTKGAKGHEAGLVVYSNNAYISCPPTDDFPTLKKFINNMSVDDLGNSTAIGEGLLMSTHALLGKEPTFAELREAVKTNGSFDKVTGKVIILFSDGRHNHGIDPAPVLKLINRLNMKVYMVGTKDFVINKKVRRLTERTGGKIYSVQESEDLVEIYKKIASMEKGKTQKINYEDKRSIFQKFLFLAIILFTCGVVMRECLLLRV